MASIVNRGKRSNTSLRELSTNPIISVKEARKLLGHSGRNLTDEDVKSLIRDYEVLARHAIRDYLVRK